MMKNLVFSALFALLIFQVTSCKDSAQTSTETSGVAKPENSGLCEGVKMSVHNANSEVIRQVEYVPVKENENVLQMMVAIQEKDPSFQFELKEIPGIGAFVESINGVKNSAEAGKYWMYCVNDSASPVGISDRKIHLCDKIDWRYIIPKEMPCTKLGEN